MERQITILPTGDVYVSDGPPQSANYEGMYLREKVAAMICDYDPEWKNAHELADEIIRLAVSDYITNIS